NRTGIRHLHRQGRELPWRHRTTFLCCGCARLTYRLAGSGWSFFVSHSLLWQRLHATALRAKSRVNYVINSVVAAFCLLRGLVKQARLLNLNYGAMVIRCCAVIFWCAELIYVIDGRMSMLFSLILLHLSASTRLAKL